MFGHLKSEEFANLIEGIPLETRSRTHLESCGRCRDELKGIEEVRTLMSRETDHPEPDWMEFRATVRDRLLSRSVRRERAQSGWSGFLWRPTPAWTLALFAAFGFVAAVYVGSRSGGDPVTSTIPGSPVVAEGESIEVTRAVWSNVSVFEEVSTLGPEESERLRELLENEARHLEQNSLERE